MKSGHRFVCTMNDVSDFFVLKSFSISKQKVASENLKKYKHVATIDFKLSLECRMLHVLLYHIQKIAVIAYKIVS